jgi:hypothetical protein
MSVSKPSVALNNLRAVAILALIAFHSVSAYLSWLGPEPFPFDQSPYRWRAFPIVDSRRWLGFDIFCGWQDVYLMALLFFLSGLFAWPSLVRKRPQRFLRDRFLRLGAPFVFAMVVLVPLALYPAYRVTAVDTSVAAYARHFLALPFWPNGQVWFLWQLLILASLAAALHRFARRAVERLAELSSSAETRPGQFYMGLSGVAALAYVPLALAFTPWAWVEHGPFGFQLSRPLLYAVFYLAGLGVGAHGLERGLLAADAGAAMARVVRGRASLFLLLDGPDRPHLDRHTSAVRPASCGGCQLRGGVRRQLLFRARWLAAIRREARRDLEPLGGKRLRYVSASLSIRHLAAVRPAGRRIVRHRKSDDRRRRSVAACLGDERRDALASRRLAPCRRRGSAGAKAPFAGAGRVVAQRHCVAGRARRAVSASTTCDWR